MPPPAETTYTPVSAADAVILYAGNFIPSWAGAIAIDLLPAVLVLIVAITQGAIRHGREGAPIEDTMTIAELRAALHAARDVDRAFLATETASLGRGVEPVGPASSGYRSDQTAEEVSTQAGSDAEASSERTTPPRDPSAGGTA